MRRPAFALSFAACLALILAPSATADDEVTVRDGKVIDRARAATMHCHDIERPIVQCFTTDAAMLKDAARVFNARRSNGPNTLLAGYVVVYEHAGWSGASRTLSQDYPNLGTIGWNDRISSLTSFGATGRFREHTPPGGLTYSYGPTTDVTYVGAVYNDIFSVFEID